MGSKIGWILSGVLVLLLATVMVVLWVTSSTATPPTLAITVPGFFERHEITLSPAGFLGSLPSGAGDAADDYRQAAEIYHAHAQEFSDAIGNEPDLLKGAYKVPASVVRALEDLCAHVSAGAAKKEMHYTAADRIEVRYANEQATQLVHVADALALLAIVYDAAKKYDEEDKVIRAMFVLGWHMAQEDARATMVSQGLEIQGGAVGYLGDLYFKQDPKKYAVPLKALEDYRRELQRVFKDYKDKLFVVWRPVPNPGDVFAVVQRDKDRAWRVEALLVTGAIRFTHAKSAGDQKVAQSLIEEYAKSPDPFVKAAATAARDLTEEGFTRVGTPPAN
jgi:hypothetical protein